MMKAVLVLVAGLLTTEALEITPVQKVIQMMNDMKAKGEEEMKGEEVTFTKFAGWCKSNARQREEAIAKGASTMSQLQAESEKLDSDAAVLGREIQELDGLIDQTSKDLKAATKQREIEQKEYEALDATLGDNIGELEAAGKQLKTMMASAPGASAASAASLIQELASKRSLPASARRVLASFLERGTETADLAAPEAHEFDSQSGGIVDVVTGLEDKMTDEKQGNWRQEMEDVHKFQMMEQTLTDEIEKFTRQREAKASTKKEKEAASEAAKGDLAEATAVKEADTKYLADLRTTCASKTTDFEARQKLRQQELDAIDEAVGILGSESVAGSAGKHLPALAQTRATALAQIRGATQQSSQSAAAAFLKMQGRKLRSSTLAAISLRVSEDPFKKVSKMIKDMIYKLQEEATDEAEHKGFCDTELATNQQTRDKLTAEVDELTAEIEGLNAKSAQLAASITALSNDITELDAAVAKATEIRTAEKEKNTATVADATAAIAAVTQATAVLKEFYAKAAGATALAQVTKGVADDMPETFDKPYTGMENGGVMGMLEVVLSDFQRLEAETTQTEDASQQEYSSFMDDSKLNRAMKAKDVELKTASKQKTESSAMTANSDLDSSKSQLDAAMKYYEELKPSCVDSGLDYEERVARRNEEVQSLQEALKILTP